MHGIYLSVELSPHRGFILIDSLLFNGTCLHGLVSKVGADVPDLLDVDLFLCGATSDLHGPSREIVTYLALPEGILGSLELDGSSVLLLGSHGHAMSSRRPMSRNTKREGHQPC